MTPTRCPALSSLALVIGMALGTHAGAATQLPQPTSPESREAVVLHARLSPTIVNQGLSPWSRHFTRQVENNPELRARVAEPARIDAVNPAFAGFEREVPAWELEAPVFRPYRWVRLSWRADSDPIALAARLRGTGLFDHVEPVPRVEHRRIFATQSSTITDPLYTATSTDPHRRQWAIDQARFKDAFHFTEGRVLIGVPDWGINPNHPDLSSAQRPHQRAAVVRYRPGPPPTPDGSDEVEGEFFEVGFFPQQAQLDSDLGGQFSQHSWLVGHGLHVAGIIAAGKNDAQGGVGGCPGCGLAPLRFIDSEVLPNVWQALGFSFGASAINMSFVLSYFSQLQLDTLKALHERDVALVASIGNEARKRELEGVFNGRSAFPGYLPFVIGVGATDATGERWHERTIMTRPLGQRHPKIGWDAVLDEWGCGLQPSSLGLTPPATQLLPIDSRRDECGSNWGRETRSLWFQTTYLVDGVPITVTLPPGQYGLDLMAPGAQVLAPLDRVYSRVVTNAPVALRDFPCWFDPSPQCELISQSLHTAPGRHLIANSGQAMGADDIFFSYSQIPRNEETLGHQKYGTMTGTSMAAPMVTAAVGLVRSANPLLAPMRCMISCVAPPHRWATARSGPVIHC